MLSGKSTYGKHIVKLATCYLNWALSMKRSKTTITASLLWSASGPRTPKISSGKEICHFRTWKWVTCSWSWRSLTRRFKATDRASLLMSVSAPQMPTTQIYSSTWHYCTKMIGEVLDKEGSQSEATRSYRNGLVITERLAIDDPMAERVPF